MLGAALTAASAASAQQVNTPNGITQLLGPVTAPAARAPGARTTTITPTGVTPGCYAIGGPFALTVNAAGQITSLVSGTCATLLTGGGVTLTGGGNSLTE